MYFLVLARLVGEYFQPQIAEKSLRIEKIIKKSCPEKRWLSNYSFFTSDCLDSIFKFSTLARTLAHTSCKLQVVACEGVVVNFPKKNIKTTKELLWQQKEKA